MSTLNYITEFQQFFDEGVVIIQETAIAVHFVINSFSLSFSLLHSLFDYTQSDLIHFQIEFIFLE